MSDQERFEQAKQKIIGIDRQRLGIGTLSEKTVHAILKNYYEPDEDRQEIPIENYVADIYADGEIIEIQTRQFNKLRDKLQTFLPLYPVRRRRAFVTLVLLMILLMGVAITAKELRLKFFQNLHSILAGQHDIQQDQVIEGETIY